MSKLFLIGLIALIIINLISTLIIANIKKKNTKEKNALYSCLVSIGIITLLFLIDTIASDNGSFKNFVVGCLSSIFYEVIFYPINLLTITINNKLRTKNKKEELNNVTTLKKKTKKSTKFNYFLISSILLNVIMIATIVVLTINLNQKQETINNNKATIKEKEQEIQENYTSIVNLNHRLLSLLNNKTEQYIKNKLYFFDNNIVFVINGYGNYYFNYDCMMEIVNNNSFTFWAYNEKAAINRGYIKYYCN